MNYKFAYKYWCPPLWLKGLIKKAGNLYRSAVNHYPLSDQANSLSCQPVFIISAGRSGTTLLRSMLVAGGSVAIPPEIQVIHNLPVKFYTLQGLNWEGLTKALIAEFESHPQFGLWNTNMVPAYQKVINLPKNERSLARLIDEVFITYSMQQFPKAYIWGDQSPIHTMYLPYIEKIFPDAKYIHLLRDGRDVIASFVEKFGPVYLDEAIYRWRISIKNAQKLGMKIRADQFLEIRYENLVKEPESTLGSICKFIDIPYSSNMLDYWKLDTTIEGKRFYAHRNLNKPVFTSSIGSWQKRLSDEQKKICNYSGRK